MRIRAFWLNNHVTTGLFSMIFDWLRIWCNKSDDRNSNPVETGLIKQNAFNTAYVRYTEGNFDNLQQEGRIPLPFNFAVWEWIFMTVLTYYYQKEFEIFNIDLLKWFNRWCYITKFVDI